MIHIYTSAEISRGPSNCLYHYIMESSIMENCISRKDACEGMEMMERASVECWEPETRPIQDGFMDCTPTPTHHPAPICALNREWQVMSSLKMSMGEVTMNLCAIPHLYEITCWLTNSLPNHKLHFSAIHWLCGALISTCSIVQNRTQLVCTYRNWQCFFF